MKKVAFITGGTRGIGLGIAIEMAKAGFDLAVNGIREESLVKPVLDELGRLGVQVIYVRGDVSKKEDRQQMLDSVIHQFGKINVLVNNAGIAPPERKDILEATEKSFEYVLNVNLQGPYFLTQLVANRMIELKKQQSGEFYCIINVSSVSATVHQSTGASTAFRKQGLLWQPSFGLHAG